MKKKIIAMSLALVVVAGVGKGIVAKAETNYRQDGASNGNWTISDSGVTKDDAKTRIDTTGVQASKDVTITAEASPEVYSVDITWGNMAITDTASEWQPDEHKYENTNGDAKFGGSLSTNNITVTNHSNVSVTSVCAFEYEGDETTFFNNSTYSNSNLTISLTNSSLPLDSAENVPKGQTTDGAGKDIEKEHTLTVSGHLNSKTAVTADDDVTVGTTTITLTKTPEAP